MMEAEEYVRQNNEESKRFVLQKFNYDPAYLESAWPKHHFATSLPQEILLVLEDQARWRVDNNLTDQSEIPNYLDFLYTKSLDLANPDAVTIIR